MILDRCFVCGDRLKLCWEGDPEQYDGTVFNAFGNYGSGLFDPMSPRSSTSPRDSLMIHVCDECLGSRRDRVAHRHVEWPQAVVTDTEWNPNEPS